MSSEQSFTPGAPLPVQLQQLPTLQQQQQQPQTVYVQQVPGGNQIQLYPQMIGQSNQQQFVYTAMPMSQPASAGQPMVFIQPSAIPLEQQMQAPNVTVDAPVSRWSKFKAFLNTPSEYAWTELVLAGFLGFESLAALITGLAFFVYFGAFICALAVFWFGLVKQSLSWLYFGIYMQFGWWLFSWPVIIFSGFWELNVLTTMCVVFAAGCYQWAYVHHQKKKLASIVQAAQEEEQAPKPEISVAASSDNSSVNPDASQAAQQLQSIQNWQSILESTITRTLSMGSSCGSYSLAAIFVIYFACAQLVAPVGYYWLTVYSFIGYPTVAIIFVAVLFRWNWVIALGVVFEMAVIIFTFVMFVSFYMNFMIYWMFTAMFAYQFGGLFAGIWLFYRNRKAAAMIAL